MLTRGAAPLLDWAVSRRRRAWEATARAPIVAQERTLQDLLARRSFELLVEPTQCQRHHIPMMEFTLGYLLDYFQPDPVNQLDILRSQCRRVGADLEAMVFSLIRHDPEFELSLVRIVDLSPGLSYQPCLGIDRELPRGAGIHLDAS